MQLVALSRLDVRCRSPFSPLLLLLLLRLGLVVGTRILLDVAGDIMVVRTKEFVQMREDNLVTPYKFVKLDEIAEFRFSPRHASLRDLLRKVTELHKAAQGSRFDRDESIDRITQEHHGNLKFNNVWLEDFNERIVYDRVCHRVTPLVRNRGRVVITTDIIYFQPFNNIESEPVSKFRCGHSNRSLPLKALTL